jgi:predicted house-cleaning NTP pyrophosphatase (Maf/HAM1 superfamily)
MKLILGSSSKVRLRVAQRSPLFNDSRDSFTGQLPTMSPDIDEKAITLAAERHHSNPTELALAISKAKAAALLPRISVHKYISPNSHSQQIVI